MFKKIISRAKISPFLIRASWNGIGIAIGTVHLRNYAVFQSDNYFGKVTPFVPSTNGSLNRGCIRLKRAMVGADGPSFPANPILVEVGALFRVGENLLGNYVVVIPGTADRHNGHFG